MNKTLCPLLVASLLAPAGLQAQDGPELDLPDDPGNGLQTGLEEQRRALEFGNTTIGGYGEVHYNLTIPEGDGDNSSEIDIHRIVLFVAHQFDENLSTYLELEVEHALAGDGAPGEVAIEQAFVDYHLVGDALALRAGAFLVPMGITNIWHEPPVFNGVERPSVERVIIPTTWREAGISFFGEPIEGLGYEVGVVSGLDPLGFSAGSGIRGGRQKIAEAVTNGPAIFGRIDVEPVLGLALGASGYWSNAGRNIQGANIDVPVTGLALDGRFRRAGFEAKSLFAMFSIGGTDELREITDDDGDPIGPDIGSRLMGGYVEVGYDVLHPTSCDHDLVPFVRFETYDTAAAAEGDSAVGRRGVTDLVFGLTYKPHPSVAFKYDTILRNPEEGDGETVIDFGIGWMF